MTEHRYRVGQAVQFVPGRGTLQSARGNYTVVRLLPLEGSSPQYRIKNKTDGHERMVHEAELAAP